MKITIEFNTDETGFSPTEFRQAVNRACDYLMEGGKIKRKLFLRNSKQNVADSLEITGLISFADMISIFTNAWALEVNGFRVDCIYLHSIGQVVLQHLPTEAGKDFCEIIDRTNFVHAECTEKGIRVHLRDVEKVFLDVEIISPHT